MEADLKGVQDEVANQREMFLWEDELDVLVGMGFNDTPTCRKLLAENQGDWKACVKPLMIMERAPNP